MYGFVMQKSGYSVIYRRMTTCQKQEVKEIKTKYKSKSMSSVDTSNVIMPK